MKISKILPAGLISVLLFSCTSQPLATAPVTPTPLRLPTFPFSQSATLSLTITPVPTATEAQVVPFALDRLRMVIVKDGNLYLQDGINPPIQLTYDGKDRDPIISHDGTKIVFYRGEASDSVYSINADGSQEQAIIVSQLLPILGRGDIKALTFVPNTRVLLFNTYLCNPSVNLYNAADCTVGIYSVDVDSGEINELVSGLSGNRTQSRNFEISPDGNYISVAASGHIDIYSYDGQRIAISRQGIIVYNRTIPDEFLPLQSWLPDSSGLIAVVPTDIYNEPATPPHTFTAWRYSITDKIDNDTAIQLQLDPPIGFNSGCNFSVSLDGNWILYVSDRISSLYLGSLNKILTRPLEWENGCPTMYSLYDQWSPDSRHFAWQNTIVTTDGEFISIAGDFRGWIDDSHYFYVTIKENSGKTYIGDLGGVSIALPEHFQLSPAYVLLDQ